MNRPCVVAALIFPVIVIFAQEFVSIRLKEADYSYIIVGDHGHGKRELVGFQFQSGRTTEKHLKPGSPAILGGRTNGREGKGVDRVLR